jgi:hypothetical protein
MRELWLKIRKELIRARNEKAGDDGLSEWIEPSCRVLPCHIVNLNKNKNGGLYYVG